MKWWSEKGTCLPCIWSTQVWFLVPSMSPKYWQERPMNTVRSEPWTMPDVASKPKEQRKGEAMQVGATWLDQKGIMLREESQWETNMAGHDLSSLWCWQTQTKEMNNNKQGWSLGHCLQNWPYQGVVGGCEESLRWLWGWTLSWWEDVIVLFTKPGKLLSMLLKWQ